MADPQFFVRIVGEAGDLLRPVKAAQKQVQDTARALRDGAAKDLGAVDRAAAKIGQNFAQTGRQAKAAGEQIARSANAAGKPVRELGGAMGAAEAQTKAFGNVARTVAKQVALLTAGALSLAGAVRGITAITRTGAEFEKLGAQLESLEGSAEGADRALQFIINFAANTPLQVEGVTRAFIRLRAFGLDPTNGTLQAIVDQTSKVGGGQEVLEGIVLALGQAWTKQKLQAEETLQLIERGVPVYDLLTEATGLATAELQDMASKGELGREAIAGLIQAMGRNATGAAARQMATFNGLVSNLADNWARFLDTVAKAGFLDFLATQIGSVNTELERMRQAGELAATAKEISDALVKVGRALDLVFSGITAIAPLLPPLAAAFIALKLGELALAARALGANTIGAARGVDALAASTVRARVGSLLLGGAYGALLITLAQLALAAKEAADAEDEYQGNQARRVAGLREVEQQTRDYADAAILSRDAVARLRDDEVLAYRDRLSAARKFFAARRDRESQVSGPDAAAARVAQRELLVRARALDELAPRLDAISDAEQALAKQRTTLGEQLAREEKTLATQREQLEKAAKKTAANLELEALKDKRSKLAEGLRLVKSALDEAVTAEKAAADRITAIRQANADTQRSIQDQIRGLRRSQLTGPQQQADLEAQTATKINDAREALAAGDTEAARELSNEARGLAASLEDVDKAVALLEGIGSTFASAAEVEIRSAKATQSAQRARFEELTTLATAGKGALDQLNAAVDAIDNADPTIEIRTNIAETIQQVERLKVAMAELPTGAASQTGQLAQGFAAGGSIPGYGGGDRISAMLEPGEFVVRKEAVSWVGLQALAQINAGRLPAVPSAPRGVQHFRTGGPVTGGGETVRHVVSVRGREFSVLGARDQVRGLLAALVEEGRGG